MNDEGEGHQLGDLAVVAQADVLRIGVGSVAAHVDETWITHTIDCMANAINQSLLHF